MDFLKNKKGQIAIQGFAMLMLFLAILFVIGPVILGGIFGSVDHGTLSTSASTAINATESTTWGSWGLLNTSLYVVAAVAILSVVALLQMRR